MYAKHTRLSNLWRSTIVVFAILFLGILGLTTCSLGAAPAAGTSATYVTASDIDAALKQMPPGSTTYDKPLKTVDVGPYKVTIVILRRISKPGSEDSGLVHSRVTEVYEILSGSGTLETGGTLVKGQPVDLNSEAAGPSVRGAIEGGDSRRVGPGDVIVIPPGMPHRFSKLEGTITYLVNRVEVAAK